MLATAHDNDLDSGPRTSRSGTARMCAVTREVRPTDDLIRFVLSPDGAVVPDLKRRLPGRGLWISASRETLVMAVKRGAFAKGFRKAVKETEGLVADTERLLAQSAVDALAIAAKAGQVVSGFAKVEACLKAGDAMVLLHAADGAKDGIRKLNALVGAAPEGSVVGSAAEIPIINALTSAELDLALSRANVIHAALLAGPAGKTFLSRIERLVRFRTSDDGKTANDVTGNNARQLRS
jgi:uncharacterized protein